MDQKISFSELVSDLFREEFSQITILKNCGVEEVFDPLILFYSLIESEIELESALKLFDRICHHILEWHQDSKEENNTLTYLQIQNIVSDQILQFDNPHAYFWLSNYSNLPHFSENDNEEGIESDDDIINVRQAGKLKQEILEFYNAETKDSSFPSDDLDEVTNRVIKLIRFCGFFCIKRDFLHQFINALSGYSTKSFFPNITISEDELKQNLTECLGLIKASKHSFDSQKENLLLMASSNFSSSVFSWLGVMASPNREIALIKRLEQVIALSEREIESNNYTKFNYHHINSILDEKLYSRGLSRGRIISQLQKYQNNMSNGAYESASNILKDIINQFIYRLTAPLELGILFNHPNWDEDNITEYINNVMNVLNLSEFRDGAIWLELSTENAHIINGYGNMLSIEFIVESSEEIDTLQFIKNQNWSDGEVKLLVFPDDGNLNMKGVANYCEANKKMISVVRKRNFEDSLVSNNDIRTLVFDYAKKLNPDVYHWKENAYQLKSLEINKGCSNYVKDSIQLSYSQFKESGASTALRSVSSLLEDEVKEHCKLIVSILWRKGNHEEFSDLFRIASNNNQVKKRKGYPITLSEGIDWLYKIHKSKNPTAAKLAISNQMKNKLHILRKKSNHYRHIDFAVSQAEAVEFLSAFSTQLAALGLLRKNFHLGYYNSRSKTMVLYDPYALGLNQVKDNTKLYSKIEKPDTWDKCLETLFYFDSNSSTYIDSLHLCNYCNEFNRLGHALNDIHCKNNDCGKRFSLGGASFRFSKAIKKIRLINNKTITGGKEQMDKYKAHFVKIGEALCVALGPFGAPLKLAVEYAKDDDGFNEKFEKLVDQSTVNSEGLSQLLSEIETIDVKISSAIAYWMTEAMKDEEKSLSVSGGIYPFGLTHFTEKQLIKIICNVYLNRDTLFFNDISQAGINTSRIRKDGFLEVSVKDFLVSLRGKDTSMLVAVFDSLSESNEGTIAFEEVSAQLQGNYKS